VEIDPVIITATILAITTLTILVITMSTIRVADLVNASLTAIVPTIPFPIGEN
jgi:hypothetical protein